MQNTLETIENSSLPKKTWVMPNYEIISKEVVRGGASPGPESTSPAVQSS